MEKNTKNVKNWLSSDVFIGILLVLSRIPYYLTRHVQEDAYIFFRTARNFVDTGYYGFNPGERVSVCTSHLYFGLLALLRLLFGDMFIGIALVMGTIATVIALRMLAALVLPGKKARVLWMLASFLPSSLMISYSGMEVSFVLLWIAIVLTVISKSNDGDRPVVAILMFVIPWLRPELFALGGLVLFLEMIKDRKIPWLSGIALVAGMVSLGVFNYAYFGEVVNHTIMAKSVAYQPPKDIISIISRVGNRLWGLYLPVGTRYLYMFKGVFFATVYLLQIVAIFKWRRSKTLWSIIMMLTIALTLPVAYAVGGGAFPWYFWPYKLMGMFVVLALILNIGVPSVVLERVKMILIGAGVLSLALLQLALSFNWGSMEYHYRGGIGRDLKGLIGKEESLMLEPLGYIPYFAECYTYCLVGLATPEVTASRRQHGRYWMVEYLKERAPDYLLQRTDPDHGFHGFIEEPTTAAQLEWLRENYLVVKEYNYRVDEVWSNPLLRRVAKMGSTTSYTLYKMKSAAE